MGIHAYAQLRPVVLNRDSCLAIESRAHDLIAQLDKIRQNEIWFLRIAWLQLRICKIFNRSQKFACISYTFNLLNEFSNFMKVNILYLNEGERLNSNLLVIFMYSVLLAYYVRNSRLRYEIILAWLSNFTVMAKTCCRRIRVSCL